MPITSIEVVVLLVIMNMADSQAVARVTRRFGASDSAPGTLVCLGSWFPFEYLRSCVPVVVISLAVVWLWLRL